MRKYSARNSDARAGLDVSLIKEARHCRSLCEMLYTIYSQAEMRGVQDHGLLEYEMAV